MKKAAKKVVSFSITVGVTEDGQCEVVIKGDTEKMSTVVTTLLVALKGGMAV